VAASPKPPAPGAPAPEAENWCHRPDSWTKLDALLKQNPADPLVIRSYALRIGICLLIDEGKISLQRGIEVFDVEKQRVIMERSYQDSRKRESRPIPLEELEPEG